MKYLPLLSLLLLTGCMTPRYAPIVSAHHREHQPYISAEQQQLEQRQLEQALVAAQETPQASALDETLLPSLSDVAGLWGRPPGFFGHGETLMNRENRKRLNDALSTTPVTGEATWRYGSQQFRFYPNSDIFQAYRSGGECRDGIFIFFDGEFEHKTRALFCRLGPGSDWYRLH